MNTEIKLSDVTKALKNAGYKAITIDDAIKGRTPGTYYKYRGAMYIAGAKVGFAINNKTDARILGAYATGATNENGETFETITSIPQSFFPRMFGYLAGEISESDIIAELCN